MNTRSQQRRTERAALEPAGCMLTGCVSAGRFPAGSVPAGRKRICGTRRGFSLIEVMIATAILMGSAIVLSKLAGMGREQSTRARLYAEAQQQCEQLLQEMLLELRPVSVRSGEPLVRTALDGPADLPADAPAESRSNADLEFESTEEIPPETASDAPRDETHPVWRYSVAVDPIPESPGMWCLTISVFQGDRTLRRPVRAELTRWILGANPPGTSGDGDLFPSGIIDNRLTQSAFPAGSER